MVVNVTFHLHSQAFEVIFDELNSQADIFGRYKPALRELGRQHPTHLISQLYLNIYIQSQKKTRKLNIKP